MSGFDPLWGDDLTENDVAECLEIETQASQAPGPSSIQPLPPTLLKAQKMSKVKFAQEGIGVQNVSRPRMNLPFIIPQFRDEQGLHSTSTSSSFTSSSSSASYSALSQNQRKLRAPVRSLPEISLSQSKEKNQSATTGWLRKELVKYKKNEGDLKQNMQTLEGEVRLLRERDIMYQQQLIKVRENADQELKVKEDKYLSQIKELKKEAESAKIQLVLKSKESEANIERYLELKNVSVLEPEFPRSQVPNRERYRNSPQLPKTPRSTIRTENVANEGVDDEDDDFSEGVLTKRPRRDDQANLKTFSCDELIRVIDGSGITSPVKRPIDILESDFIESSAQNSYSTPVKRLPEKEVTSTETKREVEESSASYLATNFPWLKAKGYSLTLHQGRLLSKEISEKIFTLSDPEIKIIVPPCIDFDPSNVLKMDCSDLQYLEDLEKGEKIWGVDLKTMYDTSRPETEGLSPENKDAETLETVKTILGSQMCVQSPDHSRLNESLSEPLSPNSEPSRSPTRSNKIVDNEDSILLRSLEPVHVHLRALTKLADWDSAMDLVSSIVRHLTLMINELYERVCDPKVPDQLKDQFYNNEFGAGKLFMNGPYESKDLLTHNKWTERERYVELRRGLAVMSILCSLSRDAANLVLSPLLLDDMAENDCTIASNEKNYNKASFLATSLRNQAHKKINSKVDESMVRYSNLLKQENSRPSRQVDQLTDRLSGSRLSSDYSSSTSTSEDLKHNKQMFSNITQEDLVNLLKSKKADAGAVAPEEDENQSTGSNPSTVNGDEFVQIMDIEDEIPIKEDGPSNSSRSMDEIDHDSFKAWYNIYTQNKLNFTVEESQDLVSKSQKFNKLLDPQLADKERKELSVYLKRRQFFKEFYKSIEKGQVCIPDAGKNDEDGYISDIESVKNLYDYENKITTMNSTITSDELASMKPGPFCPNKDSTIDTEITVKSQEDSPVENEWRVNSLQKNEEDPNLTKAEEPSIMNPEKIWSFFEKFKTHTSDISKASANTDSSLASASNADSRGKQAPSKTKRHSLAPLRKKGTKEVSHRESLSDINKEMEMEVEMLFGKTSTNKKVSKLIEERQPVYDMAPFSPELRFPEAGCEDDQKSDTLSEHIRTVPVVDDPEFEHTFKELYNQAEAISLKLGQKLKPYKRLVTCAYIEQKKKKSAEEIKKKNEESRRPKKLLCDKMASSGAGMSIKNQDESDAIVSILNEEALKKNIKSFEKKKGKLHLLDGIYEIVSAINYSRLTLVFYPLLSSCVSLMESLFKQSFNNDHFDRESRFVLIMKILCEVICCQPPPDIIEKVLCVLMHAVKFPEIVECLCKKRSNLVSLVTKTEFCFFKGVCMMQPLCYLVGVLSGTCYPGYWTLCLAFTRWLRQLYDRYRLFLESWYPYSQVCNCVPVLHSALFTTLAKASAFLSNHALELEEGMRRTVESIVHDGIRLCEILIDMDTNFVNHLDRFNLYHEFLTTVKEMHYDPHFSPVFQLHSHQLKVVECLINANELLASKSKSADLNEPEMPELEYTKLNFNRVFDPNHIFLNCSDKYDLLC